MTIAVIDDEQLAPTTPHRWRGDIEGLRAVAVLAVLAYHAELGPFHGGYVGVDVFFVVSGFLITSLLVRDLLTRGAASLPNFWARRARRLLPAAFLVVVSTLIVGRIVLEPLAQRALIGDSVAAATYTVNIVFAHRQSDYFAAQLAPSPLLHYWSLALEEQFYVVWPIVLLAATRIRRHTRRVMLAVVCLLLVMSFALCIRVGAHHQQTAFFQLPTRAWELLAGSALALVGPAIQRIPRRVLGGLGWLGLIAIVAATIQYDNSTRFPGTAATVPVAGTVAVLMAGMCGGAAGPARLLNRPVLTWLGVRSYAIYLWHWPVLVLATAWSGPLNPFHRLTAITVAVALGSLSFQLLENPVRRSAWLGAFPRRGLVLAGVLALGGVGTAALMSAVAPTVTGTGTAAAPTLLSPTSSAAPPPSVAGAPVIGPSSAAQGASQIPPPSGSVTPTTTTALRTPAQVVAAMVNANAEVLQQGSQTDVVPANLTPTVGRARSDKPVLYSDGCILGNGEISIKDCYFGDTSSTITITLFGDSHAAQWFPALDDIATTHHWRLDVLTKKGCPTADIPLSDPARGPECGPWRTKAIAHLAAEHPDLVIMSAYRYSTTGKAVGNSPDDIWRNGLQVTLDALRPLSHKLLILGDTPTPLNDVPGCLAGHMRRASTCMNTRSAAIKPGRLTVEHDLAVSHDATFAPTSDWLCTADVCPVVIGNLLVYRDNSHITTAASRWLEPYLLAVVAPLLTNK